MPETKDFTCRACGAQFDTRDKLDQHTRREHGTQGQGGGAGQEYGERGTQSSGKQGSQSGQRSAGSSQQGGARNEPPSRSGRADSGDDWEEEEA